MPARKVVRKFPPKKKHSPRDNHRPLTSAAHIQLIQPLLLSRKQAGAALNLSPRTVDIMLKRGDLRAVKLGARVLIPLKALQKLADST